MTEGVSFIEDKIRTIKPEYKKEWIDANKSSIKPEYKKEWKDDDRSSINSILADVRIPLIPTEKVENTSRTLNLEPKKNFGRSTDKLRGIK